MTTIRLEDLNLTPEEMELLVRGAQAMLPPDDVSTDGETIDSDENLEEWARWYSLTSGEQGWTGQNEPMEP